MSTTDRPRPASGRSGAAQGKPRAKPKSSDEESERLAPADAGAPAVPPPVAEIPTPEHPGDAAPAVPSPYSPVLPPAATIPPLLADALEHARQLDAALAAHIMAEPAASAVSDFRRQALVLMRELEAHIAGARGAAGQPDR